MDAVDEYIPDPVRQLDKPFLMPVEDVFSIQVIWYPSSSCLTTDQLNYLFQFLSGPLNCTSFLRFISNFHMFIAFVLWCYNSLCLFKYNPFAPRVFFFSCPSFISKKRKNNNARTLFLMWYWSFTANVWRDVELLLLAVLNREQ